MLRGLLIERVLVVYLFAVSPFASALQLPSAAQVLARAREFYAQQGPTAALPEFERALALFRREQDRHGEAIVLGHIGNCYKRLGDLPRALDHLQRALAMKRDLGDRLEEGKTLSHLGLVYWEMGDYPRAVEQLTASIALARQLGDRQLEAAALNNLSLVYDEQGDYQRSLEQYQRALELHRATNSAEGEGATLGNIGGVYLLLGQYREAMRYYLQSLAISERLDLKPSASQDLGNLALCHLGLGQISEALNSFDRALALAREAGLKKEEADWRHGKGSVLLRAGKYDAALDQYRQALNTYEQAGLKRELVEALNNLGTLHVLLGDVGTGEAHFRRAVELGRAIGYPRGAAFNLVALGDLEWRRKRHERAEALYVEALEWARQADDRNLMAAVQFQLALNYRDQARWEDAARAARKALDIAQPVGARAAEAKAWYALGEAARGQGRFEEALRHYAAGEEIAGAVGDPELRWRLAYGEGQGLEKAGRDQEAVAAYKRAVVIIEEVRSQLREERFRAGYIEDKYDVYVALVRLLLKLKRPGEAFQFSEKLRARSYLELLDRGLPPVRNHAQRQAEAELRERIRRLQRALEDEQAKPAPQRRSQAMQLFSSELMAAERAYQNFLDDLRRSEPEYAAARALAIPSTDEVQRALPARTALIEYILDTESLAVFVLTARGLEAKAVPVRAADLHARIELLRELIVTRRGERWRGPGEALRRSLIEPIEQEGWLEGIERLYIVPHAVLHYLPFAVLPKLTGRDVRFLADDYALAYLPAAAALIHGNEGQRAGGSLLALAPARARLQFAEQEARAIGEFFPTHSRLLLGRRATESSFRRLADRYRMLHLATHGYFNKFNPLLSGVELEPDRNEDGRLEVHEILGLKLQASLVALSACETALASGYFAEVPAGDDFVGLTRAFLFAGSPSVLATLWEVNDRSTLRLMRSFYRGLQRGDKAEALAKAQRAMRRAGSRYSHPYFWAPFVLVGRME